jgi:hypothetical protein
LTAAAEGSPPLDIAPDKGRLGAARFRLAGNKIESILLIFDATPWRSG